MITIKIDKHPQILNIKLAEKNVRYQETTKKKEKKTAKKKERNNVLEQESMIQEKTITIKK